VAVVASANANAIANFDTTGFSSSRTGLARQYNSASVTIVEQLGTRMAAV
jgi:hypothetical protein